VADTTKEAAVNVRLNRADWRTLHRVQMEREAEQGHMPTLTDLLSEAIRKTWGHL
jgi:hypothetical protein